MKKKILIVVFLLAVAMIATWSLVRENDVSEVHISNETNQGEIEVIAPEKPKSFDGVEMVTYKSEYGYEITHPKSWGGTERKETEKWLDDDNLISMLERYVTKPVVGELKEPLLHITVQTGRNIKRLRKNISNGMWGDKKLTDVKVGNSGTDGLKMEDKYRNFQVIFIEDNDKMFVIEYYNAESYSIVSKKEMDWVLSTFKLTQ